jgi:hypothetical protein
LADLGNPATISALAPIFGSLAGALAFSTLLTRIREPNLTPEEIQSRAAKREDPLREFSDICRAELKAMHSQLHNVSAES